MLQKINMFSASADFEKLKMSAFGFGRFWKIDNFGFGFGRFLKNGNFGFWLRQKTFFKKNFGFGFGENLDFGATLFAIINYVFNWLKLKLKTLLFWWYMSTWN